MAAMARSNRVWRRNTISFVSKFKLYKFLVASTFHVGCKTQTFLADSEKRVQAFETKSPRKILRICYLEYKPKDWVRSKINLWAHSNPF